MKVSPILCDNCTGCGSCSAICMKNAIEIRLNERGFYTPFVNLDKCVGCGQCTKFCSTDGTRNSVLKAFAVRHKDLNVVTQSRSGGFFYAVSDYIISEKKGAVYGCCLTDTYDVRHIRVTVLDDLKNLQGSKYTQSYIAGELYQEAINDVKNGLWIVFSGTPCQVDRFSALLDFNHLDSSKVILMDIVCHGVTAVTLWHDYRNYIRQKFKGAKLVKYQFRDKTLGWSKHWESYTLKVPMIKKAITFYSVFYAKLFGSCLFLRESCFQCKYANLNRPSDFTLGDFWGWEKVLPSFNKDNLGLSLILINTEKALHLFETIKDNVICEDCSDVNYLQPNLYKPTSKPYNYDLAQQDYQNLGFETFSEKYGFNTRARRVKRFLRNILLKIQGY